MEEARPDVRAAIRDSRTAPGMQREHGMEGGHPVQGGQAAESRAILLH